MVFLNFLFSRESTNGNMLESQCQIAHASSELAAGIPMDSVEHVCQRFYRHGSFVADKIKR